jgi:glycerophosphoryl diester phosphodiesterase
MRRAIAITASGLAAFAVLVYLNNSTWLSASGVWVGRAPLLAHRGLAQTFDLEGVKPDTCTATRIHPPAHDYLENTLASMAAAFAAGADMVEFDVHPTTDGQFAVFHDWTLDCRTDGKGVTREHGLPALKALDIGYGYTADGGKTFPFRGKGVGLLPSLDEVLTTFPEQRFLIHVKSNDPDEGFRLAARLERLSADQRERLIVYGGDPPVAVVRTRLPDLRTMSRKSLMECLTRYLALGWSGYVPSACEHSIVLVPVNYSAWLWGWPGRFIDRMESASAAVFVVGRYEGGEFSRGIDSVDELKELPPGFRGGIWTNRIDLIGPMMRSASRQ